MDVLNQAIAQKERELDEYLSAIDDPQLRQMLSDLSALRRTKEIVGTTAQVAAPAQAAPSKPSGQNGHHPAAGTMTMGDAVAELLRSAGRPMHINDILRELLSRYGMKPTRKSSLLSNIRKDRQNRFESKGGGLWGLRVGGGSHPAKTPAPVRSGNGVSPLSRSGFSLVGAIKELLPSLNGEFSQPVVYSKLREKHPEVADHIQRASVATTLRKLQESGLLEITFQGYGSEPRRYKKKAA